MSIVIRRNPIREMAAIQNAMDRLFEDTWRSTGLLDGDRNAILAIDVHENESGYILMSNLPGVNADQIDVTVHDGVLTITAELPQAEPAEGTRVLVNERPYGHYSRSLRLPKAVDANNVEANFDDGVLTLHLPKSADAQPRQIQIKKANGVLSDINES